MPIRNVVTCTTCKKEVPAEDTRYHSVTGHTCLECSPPIKLHKPVLPCRACGGNKPRRKRTVRMQTLEGVVRYYWYECSCGLQEGKKAYFTKPSHARAWWNAQNSTVQAVKELSAVLMEKIRMIDKMYTLLLEQRRDQG